MGTDMLAHMGNIATSSADWDDHMGGGMMGMQNMMGGWFAPVGWFWVILWSVTWILIIVALIALIRWLWKKGGEDDKSR